MKPASARALALTLVDFQPWIASNEASRDSSSCDTWSTSGFTGRCVVELVAEASSRGDVFSTLNKQSVRDFHHQPVARARAADSTTLRFI